MLYKTAVISRFVTHFLIPYIAVNTVRHSHGTFAEHSLRARVGRTLAPTWVHELSLYIVRSG